MSALRKKRLKSPSHEECHPCLTPHRVPGGGVTIAMDFVIGLLLTQRKHDFVWVIVDRLTKSIHFIPIRIDYSMDRLVELYMDEIVRLHGVLLSIVSD